MTDQARVEHLAAGTVRYLLSDLFEEAAAKLRDNDVPDDDPAFVLLDALRDVLMEQG